MYITNTHNIFDFDVINDACKHALEEFPNESCGAVINDEYIRFPNAAECPEKQFLINDPQFVVAHMTGQVQAVIHSHNDFAMASKDDQAQQIEFGIPYGIINLVNRSIVHVVFWGDTLPREPLEGRTFFYGIWDCFSLVRDFILEKFHVIAPNPPRDFEFWNRSESVFEQYIREGALPFREVDRSEVQPDDILFYNIHGTKFINHCGVMCEDGLVLHHLYNYLSKKFPVGIHAQDIRKAFRFDPDLLGNDSENMGLWEEKYD